MKLYTEIINEDTKECLIINQIKAKKQNLEEMEVEFSYDGKAYLKGYAPVKTLEELKQEKIKELKVNCKSYIFSVYPIEKQLNIINPLNDYTEEDRQNMNNFINKNRNICNEKEELIEKARTQKDIKEINIEFPEKE